MTTKIGASNIQTGAITQELIANTVTLGTAIPKIANVQVANSSWSALDDTAVSLNGGYILINGEGFVSNCQVLIGTALASSITVVSNTQIRATVASANAGTYVAYVVNPDGGTAIGVNALTYSAEPSWVTGSTLESQVVDTEISIQLQASGANTYTLQTGSSLPANTTLASNGLFSGTITGLEANTTYNFTVVATDSENQDSSRAFSVTVTVAAVDEYFNYTTLLLQADASAADNSNNNIFIDSSSNNASITRTGNPSQGSFSPFSSSGWSAFFDGSGDYITLNNNTLLLGSNDFTIEAWVFLTEAISGTKTIICGQSDLSTAAGSSWALYISSSNTTSDLYVSSSGYGVASPNPTVGQWTHLALVRTSGTYSYFVNGSRYSTRSDLGSSSVNNGSTSNKPAIGAFANGQQPFKGYISNLRVIIGAGGYNATQNTITVPTQTLTATGNTSLLTFRDNRFINAANSAFTFYGIGGETKIQPFSPFTSGTYDPAVHGGSTYLDGSDILSWPSVSHAGDFTAEAWVFMTSDQSGKVIFGGPSDGDGGGNNVQLGPQSSGALGGYSGGGWPTTGAGAVVYNQWNHIAYVRSGSNAYIYSNGVRQASSGSAPGAFNLDRIGAVGSAKTFTGFISGVRVLNGTALYTDATYTIPTAPPTNITNARPVLNFTNANIFDASAKNIIETVGDSRVSTSVKKYGTGSIYLDGSSDCLRLNPISLPRGGENFTIEFWMYWTALPSSDKGFISSFDSNYFMFGIFDYSTNFTMFYSGSGVLNFGNKSQAPINQWNHIALTRSGSSFRLFINGTISSTGAQTYSSGLGTGDPTTAYLGCQSPGANHLEAYFDDLRITRGVARYTSNFTPPEQAHPVQ